MGIRHFQLVSMASHSMSKRRRNEGEKNNYGSAVLLPTVYEATRCGKKIKIVWRGHQLLPKFLANGYLPRVSHQSRLSANDKGDNEMIPAVVHISPGIYLIAEENPGKPQLEDPR